MPAPVLLCRLPVLKPDTKRDDIIVFLNYLGEQFEKQPDRDEVHVPFTRKADVHDMYLKECEARPELFKSCSLGYFEVRILSAVAHALHSKCWLYN